MAVQANRQLQLKDASGNDLTSNALAPTVQNHTVYVNDLMHALIPSNNGVSVTSKCVQLPVQVLQAGQSGDAKMKTIQSQYVRVIKTPNKVALNNTNIVKMKTSATSPAKGHASQPTFLIAASSKLLQQGNGAAKLKVGDTITFPKSTLLSDKVASNSSGETYRPEILSTPPKIIRVAESGAKTPVLLNHPTPVNNFALPHSASVASNIVRGAQIASPVQLTTITPSWSQSPARNKRSSALNDSSQEPETKRRKTQNSDKGNKGLRHFAMLVCEKVKQKGTTTYNEVADELVAEYGEAHRLNMAEQHYDQKNIRRRVYDALNVLMAMNIIYKDKKDINWLGFPTDSAQELLSLQNEKINREQRIQEKSNELRELILQQIAFKNLVQRNKRIQETQGIPEENSFIQLPFIIVNTSKKTVIDCSISNDKYEYMFNFDNTFEIHDDIEVLKRMGMAYGLESGSCSSENLKTAQSILPPALKPFVEEMASARTSSNSNKAFSKYTLQDHTKASKGGGHPDGEADDLGSCFSMEQVLDPDDQEVAMVTDVGQFGSGSGGLPVDIGSRSSSSGLNSAMYSLTPMSSIGSESRTSTPFDSFDT